MAVHASRTSVRRAAMERALLVWLGAALACGVAWLVVVLLADPGGAVLAICGGVAVLALSAAIALAAYFADQARRARAALALARSDGDRLERRLHELVDGPLPALLARLAEGQAPKTALADFPPPLDPVVSRLLRTVVEGAASTASAAARARMEVEALENEAGRLVDSTMPAVAGRIRGSRAAAATALAETAGPAHEAMRRILQRFAEDLASGERTSAAAMAACASAAARIQAQTTRMLARLRELEDRYGDDAVFADLLSLDHEVSQMGRLADSIALLSGGRSGRRWTRLIVMESILRGAMGRINAYRRVRYHSTSEAALAGFAAEGVMHVLAELMDNAANFSPHGSMVHVYVEEEDSGVVVTIEDAGLGMRRRERERAERLVSEAADLSSLPGTRLGLAVVGRLARKHELTVSFRPSSRGGTGVVVLIPGKLVSHLPPEAKPDSEPVLSGAPAGTAAPDDQATAPKVDYGDLSLPKRRRGAALAKAPDTARTVTAEVRPRDSGSRFAAFRGSAAARSHPARKDPGDGPADPGQ